MTFKISESILLLQNIWQKIPGKIGGSHDFQSMCYKFYGKCKIFLMAVDMIFKYGKRFRYAPSFNNLFVNGKKIRAVICLCVTHGEKSNNCTKILVLTDKVILSSSI
jgi:hypothetical protein